MAAATRLDDLAARCAVYLEELRELFQQRGLAFGQPADILPFAARLKDASFREEMTSMVRSVLYREDSPLSRSELLELLALAAGGPHFEDSSLPLHLPLRDILAFCGEVLSAQRRGFSAIDSRPDPAPTVEIAPALEPASPAPSLAGHRELDPAAPLSPFSIASALLSPDPDLSGSAASPKAMNGPALSPQVADATPSQNPTPVLPPDPALATQLAPERITWRRPSAAINGLSAGRDSQSEPAEPPSDPTPALPRTRAGLLQRNYWIPGALLLVLVPAAALLLHPPHRPAASLPSPQPVVPVQARAAKPSAYGPALRSSHRGNSLPTSPGPLPSPSQQALAPTEALAVAPGVTPASPPAPSSAAAHLAMPPRPRATAIPHSAARLAAPADPEKAVFLASSGIMASHLLSAPAPAYPKVASFAHVQGQVIVQVVVSRDGRVEATRVLQGPLLLRSAAEHAIRHWRYRPYVVDGKPTDVATIVTVSYRLQH